MRSPEKGKHARRHEDDLGGVQEGIMFLVIEPVMMCFRTAVDGKVKTIRREGGINTPWKHGCAIA